MTKTLGLDTAQLLTAFFAVALVIPIWATYRYDIYDATANNSPTISEFVKADARLASFIQAWNVGLGYLFALYSAMATKFLPMEAKTRTMYKYLVILVSIVAWGFVLSRPIGGAGSSVTAGDAGVINVANAAANDNLDSVAKNVFGNLAAGSLFALPMALLH